VWPPFVEDLRFTGSGGSGAGSTGPFRWIQCGVRAWRYACPWTHAARNKPDPEGSGGADSEMLEWRQALNELQDTGKHY